MSELENRVKAAEERWKAPEVSEKEAVIQALVVLSNELKRLEGYTSRSKTLKLAAKQQAEHVRACISWFEKRHAALL